MDNNNSYIFAFATFGHPNDFRQTPLKNNNPELAKQVKVFDLSNAIKVFPNSTVYSIRKELIGNSKLISYSIYTYAQEQTSKRDGTFIGSSIILENNLAEEKYVISDELFLEMLECFNSRLISNLLNSLVNAGLVESAFDSTLNDFVFWPTTDFGKRNAKRKRKSKEKPETD